MAAKAERFAEKTHELVSFLVDVLGVEKVAARYDGTVAYHDSCAGLRELGVKAQPRRLLASVEGLTPRRARRGGDLLRLRRPVRRQIRRTLRTRSSRARPTTFASRAADTVLAGDLGCLMNMAGKLQREGSPVKARHVAEVLAGMADGPAIGESQKEPRR